MFRTEIMNSISALFRNSLQPSMDKASDVNLRQSVSYDGSKVRRDDTAFIKVLSLKTFGKLLASRITTATNGFMSIFVRIFAILKLTYIYILL